MTLKESSTVTHVHFSPSHPHDYAVTSGAKVGLFARIVCTWSQSIRTMQPELALVVRVSMVLVSFSPELPHALLPYNSCVANILSCVVSTWMDGCVFFTSIRSNSNPI